MTRLPRDLDGDALAAALSRLGYSITRQTSSHLRLTTTEHHITIPQHSPLRIGTRSAILTDVAVHFELTREQLHQQLFE